MSITVNTPFVKRSALRELAGYFYQGRISREDYVKSRANLVDHLCHLDVQPDPVVQMLLKSTEKNGNGVVDITEPQITAPQQQKAARKAAGNAEVSPDATRVMGARPANSAAGKQGGTAKQPTPPAQVKSSNTVIVIIGVLLIAVLIAAGVWFLMK
jgi:cobalamin biosynthesis Mg chelatase CobN